MGGMMKTKIVQLLAFMAVWVAIWAVVELWLHLSIPLAMGGGALAYGIGGTVSDIVGRYMQRVEE
jgi:hypothetical protein